MVVNRKNEQYDCDRTEHALLHRGSNPKISAHRDHPECQIYPWLGLCSLQRTRLPTTSDQICLPIQLLKPCIQFAKLLRKQIHLSLHLGHRDRGNKLHLGLRITVLACACSLCNTRQQISLLARYISFRNCIGDRLLAEKGGACVGPIDGAHQVEQSRKDPIQLRQQHVGIFGGLLSLLHPCRSHQSLLKVFDAILAVASFC
jgi:hypothetical protein